MEIQDVWRVYPFAVALGAIVAMLPGVALAASTTCATSVVCAEFVNTSSGVAIHGEANSGIGVRGTSVSNTGFYGASGSGSASAPGVEGESTNSTGSDAAGAFGLAYLTGKAAPAYGAIAYGSAYGVYGETANAGATSTGAGYGTFGLDPVSAPQPNGADFNAGVLGVTTVGTAVLAEANATPKYSGVFGDAPIGIAAIAHSKSGETTNPNGFAIYAESDSYGAVFRNTVNAGVLYLDAPYAIIDGSAGNGEFKVDYGGNETLTGTLTTSKGTYVRTADGAGAAMREYGARMTAPDVEDVGEAQLANGRAYVSIDARLAATIDRRIAYHVFVTPEGECNGLYITQKTPAGFAVRELHAGRSSLAFEYRIVAKPLDENGTRLETMPRETVPNDAARADGSPQGRLVVRAPLSPEVLMKRRLGARGYADTLTAIRTRETGR